MDEVWTVLFDVDQGPAAYVCSTRQLAEELAMGIMLEYLYEIKDDEIQRMILEALRATPPDYDRAYELWCQGQHEFGPGDMLSIDAVVIDQAYSIYAFTPERLQQEIARVTNTNESGA